MAEAYYYSSNAGAMSLNGGITGSATTITVNTVAGLPAATPFKVVIDPGLSTEEIVKVTTVAGLNLTVVRGWDATSAQAHSNLAPVRHMVTAEDLRLSRQHENAVVGVHGIAGSLVGTTDLQDLTNKNLSSGTNTFPASLARTSQIDTAIASEVTARNTAIGTAVTDHSNATQNVHGALGAVVGLTNTQTLTNKTISGATNTLTAIPQASVTNLVTDLANLNTLVTAATETDTGWVAITPATGWTAAYALEHRRIGVRCMIRGALTRGAGATETLGTIAVGSRPASNLYLCCTISNSGTVHELHISTAGVLTIQGAAGFQTSGVPVSAILPVHGTWTTN